MKNFTLVVTLLMLLLTGCQAIQRNSFAGGITPDPFLMRGMPQGGDSFSQGFRDGCYQFIGNSGYGAHRLLPDASPAVDMVNDPLYQTGYNHGDRYCSVYVMKGTIL
jgi:hypothetical protein